MLHGRDASCQVQYYAHRSDQIMMIAVFLTLLCCGGGGVVWCDRSGCCDRPWWRHTRDTRGEGTHIHTLTHTHRRIRRVRLAPTACVYLATCCRLICCRLVLCGLWRHLAGGSRGGGSAAEGKEAEGAQATAGGGPAAAAGAGGEGGRSAGGTEGSRPRRYTQPATSRQPATTTAKAKSIRHPPI